MSVFKLSYPAKLPGNPVIVEHQGRTCLKLTERGKAIYHPLTECGTKYMKPSKHWYVEYRDGNGVIKRVKGYTDERATQQLEAELTRKADRVRLGIHDPVEDEVKKPLVQHLADYKTYLASKGNTANHVQETTQKIQACFSECGFLFPAQLNAIRFSEWLSQLQNPCPEVLVPVAQTEFSPQEAANILGISGSALRANLRRHGLPATGQGKARRIPRQSLLALVERGSQGISPATANHITKAVRGFCRWLVRMRRIATNPMETLQLLNVNTDIRRQRRELNPNELAKLLEATRQSESVFRGLDGPNRAMLYRLASATGFRAKALASLTPAAFNLEGTPATVALSAKASKNRKAKTQPLPSELVEPLKAFLSGKPTHRAVWPGRWAEDHRGAEMLRGDLEAAGIPYAVQASDGPRYADFHSLRHTYLTMLGKCGVDLRTAQLLAGHSKPEMTARYSHRNLDDLAQAVEKLPALEENYCSEFVVTGCSNLHQTALTDVGQTEGELSEDGLQSLENTRKCVEKQAEKEARMTGLEPATTGSTV